MNLSVCVKEMENVRHESRQKGETLQKVKGRRKKEMQETEA